jgi:hypothetical protein
MHHAHEIYAEARRKLAVKYFKFVRSPDNHPCWETKEYIKEYPSVRLYICKTCVRSHTCQEPHQNCPRLTPYRSEVVVCAISGRIIGESLDRYIPGSYDLEKATIQSAAEAWKEAKEKRTEDEEVSIAVKSAVNYKAQDQLMYDAGVDMDKNSSRKKMGMHEDMARRREGIRDGDVFLKGKEKRRPSRQQEATKMLELDMGREDHVSLHSDDDIMMRSEEFYFHDNNDDGGGIAMEFDEKALDLLDDTLAGLQYDYSADGDDHLKKKERQSDEDTDSPFATRGGGGEEPNDPHATSEFAPQDMHDAVDMERDETFNYGDGGGGGERETALTHANGATIQVPRTELIYDDLYWIRRLDPVVEFVQARRAVYDQHETNALAKRDDIRVSMVARQRMSLETRRYMTPRLGWPLMRMGMPAEELLKHQRSISSMVGAFLKHYHPLLSLVLRQQRSQPRTLPEAMSVEEYTIRIDRILDLYGCFNQDPSLALSHRVDLNLQRVVLTCLTSLFVKPAMVRDVDKTLFFLWQADPFLLACEKANLFAVYPPPVSHFTLSAATVISATTNPNSRQKTSQLLNVIQNAGFAAQHLYAVFNQFTQ